MRQCARACSRQYSVSLPWHLSWQSQTRNSRFGSSASLFPHLAHTRALRGCGENAGAVLRRTAAAPRIRSRSVLPEEQEVSQRHADRRPGSEIAGDECVDHQPAAEKAEVLHLHRKDQEQDLVLGKFHGERQQQCFGDVASARRSDGERHRERRESAEKEEHVESEAAPLRLQRGAHGVQEPEAEGRPEQAGACHRTDRSEEEGNDAPDFSAHDRRGIQPEQVRDLRPGEHEQVQGAGDSDHPEDDPLRRVAAEASIEAGEELLHGPPLASTC